MSGISTHILDTSRGLPAGGVALTLERQSPDSTWVRLAAATTDADGRAGSFLPSGAPLIAGVYRLTFDTAAYFHRHGTQAFFPSVQVEFVVADPSRHHHVPLLLSPFGYSTYRGT